MSGFKDIEPTLLNQLQAMRQTPYERHLSDELRRVCLQLTDVEDVNTMLRLQGEARRIKSLIAEIEGADTEAARRRDKPSSMQKVF